MPHELSVPDVARDLAVSRARVQQLIAAGELPARKVAGRWLVDQTAVAARRRDPRPAHRPLSPRMAWGLLALTSGVDPAWLSPRERSRLRHRLLAMPVDSWAAMCRNRAHVHRYFAHPAALPRLVDDPACVRGGISAGADYDIDLVAVGQAELYLGDDDLPLIEQRYALAEKGQPNVVIHVPREVWPFDNTAGVAPRAVVALDLIDAGDDRSQRAGLALLRSELAKARQHIREASAAP